MRNYAVFRNQNGVPFMNYNEIDQLAIEILGEFNNNLLIKPQPTDIEALAEFYLDLSIQYADLSHN